MENCKLTHIGSFFGKGEAGQGFGVNRNLGVVYARLADLLEESGVVYQKIFKGRRVKKKGRLKNSNFRYDLREFNHKL